MELNKMGNTVAIRRDNNAEGLVISGLVELSEKVGKHGSEIEKLKEKTGKLDRLEEEVNAVVSETSLIRQEIRQLNTNDNRIEAMIGKSNKGTIKFRYWLVGGVVSAVILVFGCIVTTLLFGLNISDKSDTVMRESIEKTIKAQDKKHTEKIDGISTQISELRNFIIDSKRPK